MSSKDARIKLSSSSLVNAKDAKEVHLIPCKIHYNGEAKIEEYFRRGVKNEDNLNKGNFVEVSFLGSDIAASFRGRILQGETMSLPSGYHGYVIAEDRKPLTEDEDRTFKAYQQFTEFTYWNLEDKPSNNDKITKAMQWIDVSSAIHNPIKVDSTVIENNTPDTIR